MTLHLLPVYTICIRIRPMFFLFSALHGTVPGVRVQHGQEAPEHARIPVVEEGTHVSHIFHLCRNVTPVPGRRFAL